MHAQVKHASMHAVASVVVETMCLCCWYRSPIESVRGQQSGMMNANLFLIEGGPCFICRWAERLAGSVIH
jgi:hypothetical protein